MNDCDQLVNVSYVLRSGPYYDYSLASLVLFPIFIAFCVGSFLYYRSSSTFLRKRNLPLFLISSFGTITFWSVTVLYDVVGGFNYPCWLFGFITYVASPIIGGPILVKTLVYNSEVAFRRFRENPDLDLSPNGSWKYMFSHIKMVVWKGDKQDRINNVRFSGSRVFWVLWISITFVPYFVAYFLRLALEPAWNQGCFGCELFLADWIILVCINSINMLFSLLGNGWKGSKRDPLFILRECLMALFLGLLFFNLSLLLFGFDPNGLHKSGLVNWRSLSLFSAAVVVYIQSVHQIWIARSMKNRLLQSRQVNVEDRFQDVLMDRDLLQTFRLYLHSELSGETLRFMEQVDAFRMEKDPDRIVMEARRIYKQFIERNLAVEEINLPSAIHVDISKNIQQNTISLKLFDSAYADVKSHLLKDGFARFIDKLPSMPVSKGNKQYKSATVAHSSV